MDGLKYMPANQSNGLRMKYINTYLLFGLLLCLANAGFAYENDSAAEAFIHKNIEKALAEGNYTEVDKNLSVLVELFREQNDPAVLTRYCDNIEHFHTHLNNKILAARVSDACGIKAYLDGEYLISLNHFEYSLAIYKKHEKDFETGRTYSNIGLCHHARGELLPAMKNINIALDIFKKINSNRGLGIAYHNLALVNRSMGENHLSMQNNFRSLHYKKEENDLRGMANSYTNIGINHDDVSQIDSALHYFHKSLEAYRSENYDLGMANALNNIGDMHRKKGDHRKAREKYNESIKLREFMGNTTGLVIPLLNIGQVYLLEDNYGNALDYFSKAQKIADSLDLLEMRIEVSKAFHELFLQKEDFETALHHYKQQAALSDSLLNLDKIKLINELKLTFESERKARELELLKAENYLQKVRIRYIILVFALILVIIGVVMYLQKSKHTSKTISLEQKFLRAQMNPHFIYNAMNTIQGFMFLNNSEKAGDYLSDFARLVRLILENSREEFIPLAKELELLNYYLKLQQIRFDNTFDYAVHVDPNIEVEFEEIPPMLCQPIIENAIEHGLRNISYRGKLSITMNRLNGDVECIIEDNGVGLEHSRKQAEKGGKEHKPFALKILKDRLKLYHSKNKCEVTAEDLSLNTPDKTGTRIRFLIPMKK